MTEYLTVKNPMKIYLAHKYASKDKALEDLRFGRANRIAGHLMEQGHIVFSPISHSHPIAEEIGQKDHRFWLRQDIEFVRWCDEVWVVWHVNWRKSLGVRYECFCAHLLGKPVRMIRFGQSTYFVGFS